MTAPIGQRLRCALFGHHWRRAIDPREGYFLRCRRCWTTEQVDHSIHTVEQPSSGWQSGVHHRV